MNQPLVSAIINNFNYARFLPEAIESALAQTYPAVEVIVVDDGSTDDSHAVIRRYADRVIPVLKENGGQASAFNAGFAASSGELVCFLDADDSWAPGRLAAMVEAAASQPSASLIYNQMQNVDAEGAPFGAPWPRVCVSGELAERVRRSGGYWFYPPTSGLCFRRSFLERVMDVPAYHDGHLADSYLADLAPFAGPVIGIAKPLTRYRKHGANHWSSRSMAARADVYLARIERLNLGLERLGLVGRVRAYDHWPYQRLRYVHRLAPGPGLTDLQRLAFSFPAETALSARARRVAGLWRDMLTTRLGVDHARR